MIEDRNVGVVDYEQLKKADVELPVASVCFTDPFLITKLREINPEFNKTSYLNYLKGESTDDRFQDVDYENVTLNLNDYFLKAYAKLSNESSHREVIAEIHHKAIFNGFYVNGYFVKCFEIFIPKKYFPNLRQVTYMYHSLSVVNDLSVPWGGHTKVYINLHYTGQFLLELNTPRGFAMKNGNTERQSFVITDIEFLKRRKNRNHDCLLDGDSFDDQVLEKHIITQGCKAPYHQLSTDSFPLCKNNTQLKDYSYAFEKAKEEYYPKACQRISKLGSNFQSIPESFFWRMTIEYPEEVKIITQSKEVDGHALVGNIGGYIGLFLGNIGSNLIVVECLLNNNFFLLTI